LVNISKACANVSEPVVDIYGELENLLHAKIPVYVCTPLCAISIFSGLVAYQKFQSMAFLAQDLTK
jgi:hypothetical protein